MAGGNLALISGSFRELIPGGDSVGAFVLHNGTELFHVTATGDTLSEASGTFNVQAQSMRIPLRSGSQFLRVTGLRP